MPPAAVSCLKELLQCASLVGFLIPCRMYVRKTCRLVHMRPQLLVHQAKLEKNRKFFLNARRVQQAVDQASLTIAPNEAGCI